MKSLALDTSSQTASVAIFENDKLISENFLNTGFTHSQTLMPTIDFCLKVSKTNIKEINQFIVTNGPGSFTGLRIGIATIKGLALSSNNADCKSISTIEALAYNLIDLNGIICPVIDAKCNYVYVGFFKCSNNTISRLEDDQIIHLEKLKAKVKNFDNDIFLLGDGSNICYNYLKENIFNQNINLISQNLRYLKSSSLFLASKNKPSISYQNLLPQYLRLCQAQKQLLNKNL